MKRFTETTKWSDPWFRRLSIKHKAFWIYLLDNCDLAGVWNADLDLASFQLGEGLDFHKIREAFTGRLVFLPNGRWHITKFIPYQYGTLSPKTNPCHKGVIKSLDANGLLGATKPQESPMANEAPAKGLPSPIRIGEGYGEGRLPKTIEEAIAQAVGAGIPDAFTKEIFCEHEGTNWTYAQKPVTNFKSYLASRWLKVKGIQAERQKYMTAPRRAAFTPEPVKRVVTAPPAWIPLLDEAKALLADPDGNAERLREIANGLPTGAWTFLGMDGNALRPYLASKPSSASSATRD